MSKTTEQATWLQQTAGVRALDVAAIRVWGPDAREWLNGQVTNQVALLEAGQAVYALVVTVKGRIVSDLWVLSLSDEELLLIVPADRREALLAHFEKYIVMEDVEVEPIERGVVTVQGPRASDVVGERGSFPCDRLGAGGHDVIVDPADRDEMVRTLATAAAEVGGGEVDAEAWELARLRSGRPAFGADFDEGTYPQEAGLKDLAVSFTKGCYLGQEVVCMLENRGQLRRHLVQLRSEDAPEVGGEVRAGDAKVGEVRSSMHDPAAQAWLSLAYVKRAHATPGTAVEAGGAASEVTSVIGK